jgi:hypothetical protein
MRRPARTFPLWLALPLLAGGCQPIQFEKTSPVGPGGAQAVGLDAARHAQHIKVTIVPEEDGPVSAYVVRGADRKFSNQPPKGLPPADLVLASEATPSAKQYRLGATVPAETPCAVLVYAAKKTDVTVRINGLYPATADLIGTVHLAFVAFVLIGQLLFMTCWPFGWGWVRNFWLRGLHLLAILIIAAEGATAYVQQLSGLGTLECPLTTWERDYRGGDLHDLTGASLVGRAANRILFYEAPPTAEVYFYTGHLVFGLLVLTTFILVPPRWPWRKRAARAAPAPTDAAPGQWPARAAAAPDGIRPADGRTGTTATPPQDGAVQSVFSR